MLEWWLHVEKAGERKTTVLRSWGGFEQRIWQERWEIDHKDQVPQGKLAAVYSIQAKPWILLMSLLFSVLEMLGTESHCREGDCTQNSLSLLLKGKIYWTAGEKKGEDWVCEHLCLLGSNSLYHDRMHFAESLEVSNHKMGSIDVLFCTALCLSKENLT